MSSSFTEGTKASISQEIDRVKNLIEQCLMHYMNKEEVLHVLNQEQNIQPSFTKIVWQALEEQNPEFFKAYYVRVILKEQTTRFNHLLEKQLTMMNQLNTNKVALPASSDGSNIRQPVQPVLTFEDPNQHQLDRTSSEDMFYECLKYLENQRKSTGQPDQNFGGDS